MIQVPGTGLARDAVRQVNKRLLNPMMLRLAGRRYWYAAALHHTGRRSGRRYTTPVLAEAVQGGFVVPLPYGAEVDWLRNVVAAGHATLDVHGRTVAVTRPRIVPAAEVRPLVPARRVRQWRLWRIEQFLRVTAVADLRSGDPAVHDLVAELDEAIDTGDDPRTEDLTARLHALAPNAGAGSDT